MAFNYDNGDFLSFAVYANVADRDQRFFEANEGITSTTTNDMLAQASQRILAKIKASGWWYNYQRTVNSTFNGDRRTLADVDPDRIQGREQDFKDLNVYFTMAEYLLPRVTDWSVESDVNKINYYKDQFERLFVELLEDGSWYDFDNDSTIEVTEKLPSVVRLVRVR